MEPVAKHPRSNPSTPELLHSSRNPGSPSGVEEQFIGTPKTGRWTKREDDLLRVAVQDHGTEDWKHLSEVAFSNLRSPAQCHQRWQKVLSVGLKKGQWTDEEDLVVRQEVAKGGGPLSVKWADVAEVLPGRLGKQVRERWQNHLDPQLSKEPWEEAEDQLLISLQAVMGNKWSEIARAFEGRSENSVKNRWNSKQRKSLAAERKLRTGSELGVIVPRFLEELGMTSPHMNDHAIRDPSTVGIKIDFSKALKAANSPHITTCAEFRRRPQQPKGTPLAPFSPPLRFSVGQDDIDVKQAGAALIDLLRND
mmetsp:Transcript_29709/g.34979  ORF Transcript_29709/g.34979 Transcript_29709/m.34979 type:complete len:308 (-) Transcript_29709:266-1189(-)